jgi:hypothetical protein
MEGHFESTGEEEVTGNIMVTKEERADIERRAKRDWATFQRDRFEFIDPEIKSVVLELNRKGYYTNESCAGHVNARHKGYQRGVIWIWKIYDAPVIAGILKKHGLKNIKRSHVTIEHVQYSFDPIGKPRSSSFG